MSKVLKVGLVFSLLILIFTAESCDGNKATPVSSSGVKKAVAEVPTDSSGHTVEQQNILGRYKADNTPGAIKHLYIISPYSGQVILYSTVKGKVTSGGKRLTPTSVAVGTSGDGKRAGFSVGIGGQEVVTSEVLQDDGTYGSSGDYLFWWDSKGVYHQHYLTGGQIVHVSSEAISVKSVIINVEQN